MQPFDNKDMIPSAAPLTAPAHGADLAAASRRYGIPLSDWLDVSTGINPCAYPVGAIDSALFQHLPFDDHALLAAAQTYYGAPELPLAAAGSQGLIQWLPLVKLQLAQRRCRVAVPAIGYSEHAFRWRWAGHDLVEYDPRTPQAIDALLATNCIDVLIVINAHNPLGIITPPKQLLAWHAQLAQDDGWLIVDEAFIDPIPQHSIAAHTQQPGLIVLRSLGKFFGLAGVRCGFAFAHETILTPLRIAVGPWAVPGPTLAVATTALRDTEWQTAMRSRLQEISSANAELLQNTPWQSSNELLRNALFNSIELPAAQALEIEDQFAQRGIRVRRIELNANSSLLRFGLVDPGRRDVWERYRGAFGVI